MVGQPVRLQAPSIPPPSTLSTGQRLPNQPIRSQPINITLAAGESKSLWSFNGAQKLLLLSLYDDGAGEVAYSMTLDQNTNGFIFPYIWQIVSALSGVVNSTGKIGAGPTGFAASSSFSGRVTYLTASFNTDSSGVVESEAITIDDSNIQVLGNITVKATNNGASSVSIVGVLTTMGVY